MKNSTKLTRLHELLVKMMGGKQQRAVVAVKNVVGDIHHDRRLHQRMLEEDLLEWERENKFGSSSLTAGMRQSSQGQEPDQTPGCSAVLPPVMTFASSLLIRDWIFCTIAVHPPLNFDSMIPLLADLAAFESSMSECSCESALTNTAVAVDDASTMDSNRVTDVQPQPKPAACSLLPKGYEDTLRSAKYSKPKIKVSYWKHMGYWNVTITCKDRNKVRITLCGAIVTDLF